MDATPAVLVWDRGTLEAECERGAIVRAGVETYLGRSVFADAGGSVVRVRLSRIEEAGKQRVVALVSQEDGAGRASGERSVSGDESCASLDEQLTLVVALLVDAPEPETPAAEPPPPPPIPLPTLAPPSDEIVTAPSLQQPAPSPAHFAVLGFGAASIGATPGPGVGAGLALSFKPRGFWGIGLEGAALSPSRVELETGSLEVSMVLAAATLCPLQGADDSVWWSACASLGGARLHARSRGLLEAHADNQWFLLPGLSARGARIIGKRWLLGGGLLASVPVGADRYVYRDAEGRRQSAFQASSLVVTAHVGVGWILN